MLRELTTEELFFVCGGDGGGDGGGGGDNSNDGSGGATLASASWTDVGFEVFLDLFGSTPLNVGEPAILNAARDAAARDAAAQRGDTSVAPDGAETGGHA